MDGKYYTYIIARQAHAMELPLQCTGLTRWVRGDPTRSRSNTRKGAELKPPIDYSVTTNASATSSHIAKYDPYSLYIGMLKSNASGA